MCCFCTSDYLVIRFISTYIDQYLSPLKLQVPVHCEVNLIQLSGDKVSDVRQVWDFSLGTPDSTRPSKMTCWLN